MDRVYSTTFTVYLFSVSLHNLQFSAPTAQLTILSCRCPATSTISSIVAHFTQIYKLKQVKSCSIAFPIIEHLSFIINSSVITQSGIVLPTFTRYYANWHEITHIHCLYFMLSGTVFPTFMQYYAYQQDLYVPHSHTQYYADQQDILC